jgi:hypothetical protein
MEMPPEPPPPDEFAVCDSGYASSVPLPNEPVVAGPSVSTDLQAGEPVSERVGFGKKDTGTVSDPGAAVSAESGKSAQKVIPSEPGQNQKPGNSSSESAGIEGWVKFVAQLTNKNARLGSMLQASEAHLLANGTLKLAVAAHSLMVLDNDSAKADIIALWSEIQGVNSVTSVEFKSLAAAGEATVQKDRVAAPDNGAARRTLPGKEEIFNDPSVRFISERFGGRVTDIRKK